MKRIRRKRVEKKVAIVKRPLTFFYEADNGEYRWWRNDHPGDVFDMISKEELEIRVKGAAMCGIQVVDHLPGFCSDMANCPDHLGYY
jgi:hypothetical protein